MNSFKLDYRKFERNPQIHQLNNKFILTIEELFETLEIEDVYMIKKGFPTMIEPILS